MVDVRDTVEGQPLKLELAIGDSEAYDHSSVVRAGFHRWFSQRDVIDLVPGQPLPLSPQRQPPRIEITRGPATRSMGGRVTISGVVTDDSGVSNVMVFAGGNKVFFEGGGTTSSLRSVPFTADVELEPGTNTLTVLATDNLGFVASESVVTWLDDPNLARAVEPATP